MPNEATDLSAEELIQLKETLATMIDTHRRAITLMEAMQARLYPAEHPSLTLVKEDVDDG